MHTSGAIMRQGNLPKEQLIGCSVPILSRVAACTEQTAFSLLRGLLTVEAFEPFTLQWHLARNLSISIIDETSKQVLTTMSCCFCDPSFAIVSTQSYRLRIQ